MADKPKSELGNTLFEKFSENFIEYCHFKSNEHLTEGLTGETDLDVLVAETDYDKITHILSLNGFIKVWSPYWSSYPGIEDWLGYNKTTQSSLHIHLHYSLRVGKKFVKETHLPWESILLQTCVKDTKSGLRVSDPNLELLLLFIRIGLKTRNTQLLHARIKGCTPLPKNIEVELDYLYALSSSAVFTEHTQQLLPQHQAAYSDIYQQLNSERTMKSVSKLRALARSSTKKYRKQAWILVLYRFYSRNIAVRVRILLKRFLGTVILKKTLPKSGVIVAILGADGSGKSTLCPKLTQALSWKLETKQLYLGRSPFFRWVGELKDGPGTKRKNVSKSIVKNLESKKQGIVTDLIHLANARHRYRTIKRACRLRARGYIVVTDRFPQTQFLGLNDSPSIQINGTLSRLLSWYEKKLYARMEFTQPDVVIKLSVTKEVAQKRKPDHNKSEIERKINVIDKISFPGAYVSTIDTVQNDIDMVLHQAQGCIWLYLHKRYAK